jgi:hypothetical protein
MKEGTKMSEKQSFPEALAKEIERNRELLETYKELPGNVGIFGAIWINRDINHAIEALASGDVVEMIKAYESMKDNE